MEATATARVLWAPGPQVTPLAFKLAPRSGVLTTVALVVGGAALVAILAQISIKLPFTPVPITGQTLGVLLVGTSLGLVAGAASLTLYVLAGIVGAPVYADHSSGFHVLQSATGGYLVGFIAAAALTGLLAQKGWDRQTSSSIGGMLCGNVVIYVFGVLWLRHVLHVSLEKSLEYGVYPFIIGDLIKIYFAAFAFAAAWKLSENRTR
jgi:biotin transport system substrate-specific component